MVERALRSQFGNLVGAISTSELTILPQSRLPGYMVVYEDKTDRPPKLGNLEKLHIPNFSE
jgi:hypothetical protein